MNAGPGPRSRALARRLARVESRNVTYLGPDFPVFWANARGASVTDVDGRRYLDLTSAFGVASLGHGDSGVRRALARQARALWHGMGDVHPTAVKVELLEALTRLIPGSKGILSSSGAEAVESALKTAMLATGRSGVIAFDGGYHGLTYGALATTARADFSAPFRGQIASFVRRVPYPTSDARGADAMSIAAVEKALSQGKIGAIVVEPVQARGGIRVPPKTFLPALQRLAHRSGALLIVDEIYTGFGRTGRLFAFEHSGFTPDLVCVGKAMAGGFPLSACLGRREIMDAWPVSDGEAIHTSTFLGNPLGCAMALAVIPRLSDPAFHRRVAARGAEWMKALSDRLARFPIVGQVRGLGLMVGIEIVSDRAAHQPNPAAAGRLMTRALGHGLILLSGGDARNVLTLTPPLTWTLQEEREATERLVKCFEGESA